MHRHFHPIPALLAALLLGFAFLLPLPAQAAEPTSPLAGKLRITELMEKNRGILLDEDGDLSDWIELANLSDKALSLDGCHLSDKEGRYGWALPKRSLAPGERLLLFASNKDRTGDELHTSFALSAGECVYLYDGKNRLVDAALCGDGEADVAMALDEDGSWGATLYPTPGYPNDADGYAAWQKTLTPAGPLVINEAAVRNMGLLVAGGAAECDWVEIKNISDKAVNLSDYYLSDKSKNPRLWRMPNSELAPGKCILFVCEEGGPATYGSTPNTGFSLNAANEQLYLTSAAGELLDMVSLRDIPFGGSYGRTDGKAGFFYFAKPTPGKDNTGGYRRVSAMPWSLTEDGVFEGVKKVTLELAGKGELHYSINGSAPTKDSPLYTGPIELDKTCVVSVKSFEPGALPSRTLALSFIINEGHSLPVASFVAEDFKEFSGLYGTGVKGYEMPGSLSLYRDGDSFTINCGVTLNGETSLVLPKKNLAVHFSGAYGQPTLEHDLFGGGVTSFSALLLRAGQDQTRAVVRNELAQRMAEKADAAVINQRSLYCVLYLNGEYQGIYTVKERANAALYASLAGVEEDSVECFEAPAVFGTDFYRDTISFVNANDMRQAESYARFCEVMDIDSLIDWLFLEGYCANTDVTSGNLRYARSDEADGKWHLLFYDLDAAFAGIDSVQSNLLNGYAANRIQVAAFSYPLMKNQAFREQFLSRAAALLSGPLSNASLLEELDRMVDELRPEIARDFSRVGSSASSWEKAVGELRSMIEDKDWCQANINTICRMFELTADEREQWFGDIDKGVKK